MKVQARQMLTKLKRVRDGYLVAEALTGLSLETLAEYAKIS